MSGSVEVLDDQSSTLTSVSPLTWWNFGNPIPASLERNRWKNWSRSTGKSTVMAEYLYFRPSLVASKAVSGSSCRRCEVSLSSSSSSSRPVSAPSEDPDDWTVSDSGGTGEGVKAIVFRRPVSRLMLRTRAGDFESRSARASRRSTVATCPAEAARSLGREAVLILDGPPPRLCSWHSLRRWKASSLSQNDRKKYSLLAVMTAIAFGMKTAVYSLVTQAMWE
mmetsp:Transcript_6269/g.18309  ORF Transcript_6269/g.18309 Transcript_6269/m.18309 type:complete len:222 (-) Transcript_6269:477-1142(-)